MLSMESIGPPTGRANRRIRRAYAQARGKRRQDSAVVAAAIMSTAAPAPPCMDPRPGASRPIRPHGPSPSSPTAPPASRRSSPSGYGIEIVPLHLIFGGRTFVDSLTADTRRVLRAAARRRSDRADHRRASPGMFLEAISRAARRADAVLCITVSKQFSAMYDSARQAIEIAQGRSRRTPTSACSTPATPPWRRASSCSKPRAPPPAGATIDDVARARRRDDVARHAARHARHAVATSRAAAACRASPPGPPACCR